MEFDETILNVLKQRYLLRNDEGKVIEEPEQMFERVGEDIAKSTKKYNDTRDFEKEKNEFTEAMKNQRFMPNSPCLMNAGSNLQQLAACFVLPIPDSMEGIYESVKNTALIHQSGGGTGFSFSRIRPEGDIVQSTGGKASGPLSFLEVFNESTNTVKQGGCVDAEARIPTSKGFKPLCSIHNAPMFKESLGSEKDVKSKDEAYHSVRLSSDSSVMDVLDITTKHGYEISVTPNHLLYVVNNGELEFKEAKELSEGDIVVLDCSDKSLSNTSNLDNNGKYPSELDREVGKFLGILWSDGTFDGRYNRILFTLGKEGKGDEVALEFIEEFTEKYNINCRIIDEEKRQKGKCWRLVIQEKSFLEWIKNNGLVKKDDYSKLPKYLYESSSGIRGFLSGLTCDASISRDANTFVYSTHQMNFAKTIQKLLLYNGILSKVSEIKTCENRYSNKNRYTVRVNPGEDAKRFHKKINEFLSVDNIDVGKGGQRQNRIEFVSEFISDILDEYYVKDNKYPESVERKAMKELRRYERGKRAPSKDRLEKMLNKVNIDTSEYEIFNDNYTFQRISSITENEKHVMDIEVLSGSSNYIANGFIVHNKRRGANMGILHISHPDIYDWVTAKEDEENFTNFNMSVAVDQEFMEAVKNEEEYELINPRNNEVWGTIDAKQMFDEICEQAHQNGEPGIIFIDKINQKNPFPVNSSQDDHYIEATNPCLTGDMRIAVADGKKEEVPIKELAEEGEDVPVYSLNDKGELEIQMGRKPRKTREDMKILEIQTGGDVKIRCTEDHKIRTKENGFLEAQDLREGMEIKGFSGSEEEIVGFEVIDVEEIGYKDVYNITVDKNHNYFCGIDTGEGETKDVYVNVRNCGEQPLEPYGACNLGHINLSKCFDGEDGVDWDYLEDMVDLGVCFLDNVVDRSEYPIEEIEDKVAENRKIGLGVMGWHDLLMKLGIPYNSEKALDLAEEIMVFINKNAHRVSKEIAKERGVFPAFEESTYNEKRRNATLTTIAPTGTTSMIADCSSGIEPVYALTYEKQVMDNESVTRTNDILEEKLKERDLWTEEIKKEIKETGSIQDIEEVPEDLKEVFKTAMEIDPEWHIKMQAAFQEGTDDAVSKTINFSESASVEDIKKSYMMAFEEGCKGLTIYRDKSRKKQALETSKTKEIKETGRLREYDRDSWLEGETKEMKMGCQKNLFVTCNSDSKNNLREVFGVLGKPGGCIRSFIDSLGIVISIALQEGVEPERIIEKLKMIRCPNPDTLSQKKKYSCPDAIGRTMEEFVENNGKEMELNVDAGNLPECPDCGRELVFEEGCVKCHNCGYSKC